MWSNGDIYGTAGVLAVFVLGVLIAEFSQSKAGRTLTDLRNLARAEPCANFNSEEELEII